MNREKLLTASEVRTMILDEVADYAERVRVLEEAVVALADGADKCGEAPHYIVQPFLAIYKKHGDTIASARDALQESGGAS